MDNHFTHVDAAGNARMVDVGEKAVTHRTVSYTHLTLPTTPYV